MEPLTPTARLILMSLNLYSAQTAAQLAVSTAVRSPYGLRSAIRLLLLKGHIQASDSIPTMYSLIGAADVR